MAWIPGWDSVAGANVWSNIFFWAGIAALLFLGVSEVVSHRYTERKDELTAEERRTTDQHHDEEIARLHLETAQAEQRAGEANAAAAAANTRAANLEVEAGAARERAAALGTQAEKLRQDNLSLQAKIVWRQLDASQCDSLHTAMDGTISSVLIQYPAGDPEALLFAITISNCFGRNTKWEVFMDAAQFANALPTGLLIAGTDKTNLATIERVLSESNVPFVADERMFHVAQEHISARYGVSGGADAAGIKIIVGSRPVF